MRPAVLALLGIAALPLAAHAAEQPADRPVGRLDGQLARLVAPASGSELRAGSLAVIEWEELALPAGVEEWEAFLSVDGGRTWPLRVTPHLDRSIRRFAFRVPDLPTQDARLQLRFGDERREVDVETPQRYTIEPRHRSVWEPQIGRSLARGERRPSGEEGVAVWIEGSRSGSGLREVVASDSGASMEDVRPADLLVLPFAAPPSERSRLKPPPISTTAAAPPAAPPLSDPPKRPAAPVSVRLLTHRFNE
ncbi:MAG TPA: hypothetical protein VE078_07150 [Thermoanaerobaculia bacterium]|nr:hypothetical protein [Thermoanaerobaculia bacterium]